MSQLCTEREPVDLVVDGVSVSFGNQEVLRRVSFEVQPGEIFAIMGPSGSGKSVLLRTIAGLVRPTSGDVRMGGHSISRGATRDAVVMAMVFQAGALFNSMTVFDNLAFFPREHRMCPEKVIREKVDYALRILSLEHAARKIPAELSGGMRKRVAIARALVMEPQIVLYDEPTSELDPIMASTIAEIIATIRNELKVTTVVVTHDRDLSFSIPDRVAVLMEHRLLAVETPARLRELEDPRIRRFLQPEIDLQNPRFRQKLDSVAD